MKIKNQTKYETVDKLCAGGTFCNSLGIYLKEGESIRFARHGMTV